MADSEPLDAVARPGGVSLAIHVKPRSSRSAVLGVRAGRLEIAVHAPPVDGAANDELCETLAAWLGLPRSAVTVERGAGSRSKRVFASGATAEDVQRRLRG